MTKVLIARGAVALACLLALPAAAQAALPKPHNDLIVPNQSIGGVKLDSSYSAAKRAWGPGGSCNSSTTGGNCAYKANSLSGGGAAFVLATTATRKVPFVVEITISAGYTNSSEKTPDYKTSLADFKTSSGIGLGSTLTQLRHAYPHATHPATDPGLYKLKGPGQSFTLFGVTDGRISQIALQAIPLG